MRKGTRDHRATVRSISERAGVSASTVSRALKGDMRISEKTRVAILGIAREEGYTPNASARTLVTRRSGVIGFVMGEATNPFYPEMLERLTAHLDLRGLRLMLLHAGAGPLEAETVQALIQYQMDGVLIASAQLSSSAAEICTQHRVPMVMINRLARIRSCAVLCHNKAGGRLVGDLLIEAGHRRIAFVAGRPDTSTSEDREAGLLGALSAAGLGLHARREGLYTYQGGFAAARDLLGLDPPPDAIFSANDIMALGVLDAIRLTGLRVRHDVSVVGFDDIQAASWPVYDLTTIAQPVDAMIERALDLLLQRMEDPSLPGEDVYIHGELRRRGSARLPPTTLVS